MFYNIEFLIGSQNPERVEVAISTPKEAVQMVSFLEDTKSVIAFKCLTFSPSQLGMAPDSSFNKLRLNGFTQEDYNSSN